MPKDPKRNLQRYQTRGGHLNEFEFQKTQRELAEESDLPFFDQTRQLGLNQAERVAAPTADAHQKVERRKKTASSRAGGDRSIAPAKSPTKKRTRKSAEKKLTPSRTKNRGKAPVEAKKSSKKLAKSSKKSAKSSKKTPKQASTKRKA